MSGRSNLYKSCAVVAGIAWLVYANTLDHELVFDDQLLILQHSAIPEAWNLPAVWMERFWGNIWPHNVLYRPLTLWSLSLNFWFNQMLGLPGEHTTTFHLVNQFIHTGVSVLTLVFAMRVGLPLGAALAGALIFATHPIHTEAVTMITGRSELFAAGFGIAFLILHRRRQAIAATICYALALCSKESALAFLAVAFAMDMLLDGRLNLRSSVRYLPVVLVSLAWFGVRSSVIDGIATPPMTLPLSEVSGWERVLTAAHIQVRYLVLLVFPVGQSSDYSVNQIPVVGSVADPLVIAFVLLALVVSVLAWRLRRSHPFLAFCILSYAILFAPASNFLIPIGTVMGERLAYAPSILTCIAMGWVFWQIALYRERLGWGALAVVVMTLSLLTLARNTTWANPDVFAASQYASAPESAKANYNFGRSLHRGGDLEGALTRYRRAVEIKPLYPDAWNNLGVAMREGGDLEGALEAGRRAVMLSPDHARAHYNLGLAHQDLGDDDEAAAAYRHAVRYDPAYPEASNNLAMILAGRGEFTEARKLWEAALARRPDYEVARINLKRLDDLMRVPSD